MGIISSVLQRGGIYIIICSGYIDSDTYTELKDEIGNMLKDGKYRIVVDFENVHFMSSSGWGVLTGNVSAARKGGGDIKLASMNYKIKEIYEIIELDELIDAYDNVEGAIEAF